MNAIRKCFVTGGAGFIGANLCEVLVAEGHSITVYDNLSSGSMINLSAVELKINFIQGDIANLSDLKSAMQGMDEVYHFAANADVRGGITDRRIDLESNVIGTLNVLEAMHFNKVKKLLFTSTAAIYGDPEIYPTPETYSPTQTSVYGASKFSGEAYIQAYSEYFDIDYYIFRFVSFLGKKYQHGVVIDFYNKLLHNQKSLDVLGDGQQKKSFLDIQDGIRAILLASSCKKTTNQVLNVGHDESITVSEIASIVIDEMKLDNVTINYGNGQRGWIGDSPKVLLDTARLKSLGWSPTVKIEESIRITVRYLQMSL